MKYGIRENEPTSYQFFRSKFNSIQISSAKPKPPRERAADRRAREEEVDEWIPTPNLFHHLFSSFQLFLILIVIGKGGGIACVCLCVCVCVCVCVIKLEDKNGRR